MLSVGIDFGKVPKADMDKFARESSNHLLTRKPFVIMPRPLNAQKKPGTRPGFESAFKA